jgi:porin
MISESEPGTPDHHQGKPHSRPWVRRFPIAHLLVALVATITEAMAGTLYMTVLIARLVAMYSSNTPATQQPKKILNMKPINQRKDRTMRTTRTRSLLAVALVGALAMSGRLASPALAADQPAAAQPSAKAADAAAKPAAMQGILPIPDYTGDFWNRSTLTGDWGGLRTDLAKKGFTVDSNLTQVGQTVFSGGRDNAWKYGGRINTIFNLDTGHAGLWPGGLFTVETEGKFGETVNPNTGAVMPVNANGIFPEPIDKEWTIPSVTYMQFLTPQIGVMLGKLDMSMGDANAFADGKGNEQFMNLAFGLNPALLVSTPYSTLGGGLMILPTHDIHIILSVFDPNGRADTTGFDDPFKDGPAYSVEGRLTTHFFDLTGHQLGGAIYSSKNYTNLDQPLANLIIPFLPADKTGDTWAIYYNFDQYLYQPDKKADQGVGVFGRFGATDGKANPIHYFASGGVGGKGVIPGRKYDQCGIGYYYLWATLPQRPIDVGLVDRIFADNSQGFEVFYEIALTPWMRLTPDLQIIDPPAKRVDTAWVAGVRLELKF